MNILELAIAMEVDLEKHYLKQAQINKDNSLNTIFLMLAQDEKNHAKILLSKSKELDYELEDNKTLLESKKIFKEIKNFNSEIKDIPSQLDSFRMALDMEKKSIDAYNKLLEETEDVKAKELFEYLIGQENEHFALIEELILLLSRPEEWIENAEFGIRKEY